MHESAFSAFGSTEPLYDPGGERIRWFCPWLISGQDVLLRALNNLSTRESQVSASRVTARIISEGDLSPACEELLLDRGFKIEARVTMSGDRNLVLSYIGKCAQSRRSNVDDIRQEKLMIDEIQMRDRIGPAGIMATFKKLADFRVERVGPDSLNSGDIERLVCLHKETFPTFPYNFRKKLEIMLGNPGTYEMVIVRSLLDQQVCAFSNLELNTLKLDDGTLIRLAEYDNTMRLTSNPEHGVLGGLGVILRLELALLAAQNKVDLCHSESRAALVAINNISHQMGMHFGGALEKHLLISGQSDIDYKTPSRFETLNVWYLNQEDLTSVEAECSDSVMQVPGYRLS